MVNRQAVRRRSDLHDALRTTVFSPEDIGVVRSGPSERRRFLDETMAVVDPKAARAAEDVEKILRQRSALLRTSGRKPIADVASTLDVWDTRLDAAGTALVEAREWLVGQLAPMTEAHYSRLAGEATTVTLDYQRSWSGRLLDALAESRAKDLERGLSLTGPHRDELELSLGGPSRPYPRLPRGAAVAGPGTAARRPSAGHRATGHPAGLAPRRRVLRARPVPGQGVACGSPPGPGALDHGPSCSRRGFGGKDLSGRCRRPHRPEAKRPARGLVGPGPHEREKGPQRLETSLDAVTETVGPGGLERDRTPLRPVAGHRRSGHGRPCAAPPARQRCPGGERDHPAWATQVRSLGDELLDRVVEETGAPRPGRLEVRVRR